MFHIHRSDKSVFPWYEYKDTAACGYAWWEGAYLTGPALAEKIRHMLEQNLKMELLSKLNGFFAFIHKSDTGCVAAVDHLRSIPLFYARRGDDLYLSDNAEWIRSSLNRQRLDKNNTAEFLIAHIVTGNETLFPDISQLMAGEMLEYTQQTESSPRMKRNRYFKFSRSEPQEGSPDDFIEQMDRVHLEVFSRLAENLDGRQAVIPLSGGFDSRLIAVLMLHLGYDNLKFISYGRPGNWESRISKEIADHFGADWHFVPLSQNLWADSFHREQRREFTFHAGNFSSHTIIQEYPVLHYLAEQGIVEQDAVFIPGHSGGFTSGKHIPTSFLNRPAISREELYDHILGKNYSKWKWQQSEEDYRTHFYHKIHSLLHAPARVKPEQACNLYEEWIWQERQAKFIVNSIRNFEHFGFEWRLPLWDRALLDFWTSVPLNLLHDQHLLRTYFNQKHKLPVTEANSLRLAKVYDRYYPTAKAWMGRYIDNRNLLQAMSIKLKDVLAVEKLPYDFIPPEKRVLFSHINAMGSIKYIEEILEKTGSAIE